MTERMKPYIGVSGVVHPEQQGALHRLFNEQGLSQHRTLAMGVKATHKTQYLDVENKYGSDWYPVGDAFVSALHHHEDTYNIAQLYMEPDQLNNVQYADRFIETIARRGKAWLHALQFDMLPWHTTPSLFDFLARVKADTQLEVILQAHQHSMEHFAPAALARVLGKHADTLDYVLLDSSHGKGLRLDTTKLRPYADALFGSEALSKVGIGIAGGLRGSVVAEALPEMLSRFPELSWDAEGQLHPLTPQGSRPVSFPAAQSYFEASATVLRGV